MLVAVDGIVGIFGIFEGMANHDGVCEKRCERTVIRMRPESRCKCVEKRYKCV